MHDSWIGAKDQFLYCFLRIQLLTEQVLKNFNVW
jgi:hypothetical protein